MCVRRTFPASEILNLLRTDDYYIQNFDHLGAHQIILYLNNLTTLMIKFSDKFNIGIQMPICTSQKCPYFIP